LRTEEDRQAIIEGVLDGTLDCVATDHAPHTDYEKDVEFDYAPNGIIGLETSLGATLEILYHSGRASLPFVIDLLSRQNARILNLREGTLAVGSKADITLIDPDEVWTVPDKFESRSSNSPWIGRTLRGRAKRTIVAGKTVWDNGAIV